MSVNHQLKRMTLRDLREESDGHSCEMAYRKGCHQTAARINDLVVAMTSRADIVEFLGLLEDVLEEFRYSGKPQGCLLDEAVQKVREMQT